MKNTTIVFATVLTFNFGLSTLSSFSQDIHFSQFWMAPLVQNPALAGANYDLEAIINYKDQWRSVASPYKTFDASFDVRLKKDEHVKKGFPAVGVNFFSDKAGDAKMGTLQGNLNAAYHVVLNDNNTLGGGLMGGFAQRSMNYAALRWGSQYNGSAYDPALPADPITGTSRTVVDLGAGLAWTYKQGEGYVTGNDNVDATAGVAVFHLNQPKYSFSESGERLYTKIVAHGNVLYAIKNTRLSLVPGFMFYKQGSAQELLFGSLVRFRLKQSSVYTGYVKSSSFALGMHYRSKDAVIASAHLEMGQYAMGISYDVNLSGLKTVSTGRGGLEISLRFVGPNSFLYKASSRF